MKREMIHLNNKTVYINDFIKQKYQKEELSSLEFDYLQLMCYVSTMERQIIKLRSNYVISSNLSIRVKVEGQFINPVQCL